jgi:hypothetical protein
MHIVKVYITSKGMFWSKADALLLKNRARQYSSHPGDPSIYEPVNEAFVLVANVGGEPAQVFALLPAEVK